jgi:molybdate transport system ATP-binding protein
MQVEIRHRIGGLKLNVEFQLSKPWTVLFAASGAGKTTVLRTIAGLMRAEEANIAWRDAGGSHGNMSRQLSLVLSATRKSRFTPPHARWLPMVTQDSALFPHLTVTKNVSYGFRADSGRFEDKREEHRLLNALLEICRIEHLADKMPAEISGGERQRVALARALGADGLAVLLDEPFAGIDGTLKDELMRDVKTWLGAKRVPVLHVTHDVGEVFAVADEVIRLGEGRVIGQGPPEVVLREERERLVRWLGR